MDPRPDRPPDDRPDDDPLDDDPLDDDRPADDRPADDRSRARSGRRERKAMLLRLDPEVHDALARWAADELRSTNAHVEWLLRKAVTDVGRLRRDP